MHKSHAKYHVKMCIASGSIDEHSYKHLCVVIVVRPSGFFNASTTCVFYPTCPSSRRLSAAVGSSPCTEKQADGTSCIQSNSKYDVKISHEKGKHKARAVFIVGAVAVGALAVGAVFGARISKIKLLRKSESDDQKVVQIGGSDAGTVKKV